MSPTDSADRLRAAWGDPVDDGALKQIHACMADGTGAVGGVESSVTVIAPAAPSLPARSTPRTCSVISESWGVSAKGKPSTAPVGVQSP